MIPSLINPLGIKEYWPLTLRAIESSTVKMTVSAGSPTVSGLKYRKKGQAWASYTIDTVIELNAGEWVQFRNEATTLNASGNMVQFALSGKLEAFGDLMSMLNASACSSYCFASLFEGSTALYSVRKIRFPINLASSCLQAMLIGCINLQEGPLILPARTLASSCYAYMFYSCSSMKKFPALPATSLANSCYNNMFDYCSTASNTIALPATTLYQECYRSMFYACSSLRKAPYLPATALANMCYYYMFGYCSGLNEIEVNFTDWNTDGSSTSNWMLGVSASGTFVKPTALAEETGASRIPSGWTVVNKGA